MDEVQSLISVQSTDKTEGQTLWQSDGSDLPVERPRPPQLLGTVSSLRSVGDKVKLESLNALAVNEASNSKYRSKQSSLQSNLVVPTQGVETRKQQLELCQSDIKTLLTLQDSVGRAIDHGIAVQTIRESQAIHFHESSQRVRQLNTINRGNLIQLQNLMRKELLTEAVTNGGTVFDTLSLRRRTPEDVLEQIVSLTQSLLDLLDTKMRVFENTVDTIAQAFTCPTCESGDAQLKQIASDVQQQLTQTRSACAQLEESFHVVDQTDREKIFVLSKELEEMLAEEKLRDNAEKDLAKQRAQSILATDKMVGFLNHIPSTFPSPYV